jgi:hypothetical protein
VSGLSRKYILDVSQPYGPPGLYIDRFILTRRSSVSELSRICGSLDVSQPYGFPRRDAGTVSNFTIATTRLVSTRIMNVCYIVTHELENILLFQCIVFSL